MFSRIFFITLLLSSYIFATSNYTVRLAVYKSKTHLQNTINKLPPALKNTVQTYKKNHLYYAHTLATTDQKTLKKLLPAYRKVFNDAYISPTRLK